MVVQFLLTCLRLSEDRLAETTTPGRRSAGMRGGPVFRRTATRRPQGNVVDDLTVLIDQLENSLTLRRERAAHGQDVLRVWIRLVPRQQRPEELGAHGTVCGQFGRGHVDGGTGMWGDGLDGEAVCHVAMRGDLPKTRFVGGARRQAQTHCQTWALGESDGQGVEQDVRVFVARCEAGVLSLLEEASAVTSVCLGVHLHDWLQRKYLSWMEGKGRWRQRQRRREKCGEGIADLGSDEVLPFLTWRVLRCSFLGRRGGEWFWVWKSAVVVAVTTGGTGAMSCTHDERKLFQAMLE